MDKELILSKISNILAIFSRKIEILSRNNENSINILAENLFARIFDKLFDTKLRNSNYGKKNNFPAIDLIDLDKRVAFQVSATATSDKVYHTLEEFVKNMIFNDVDTLYIFFTTKRKYKINEHRIREILNKIPAPFNFEFDSNIHVFNFDDIYKLLNERNDNKIFEEIYQILDEELESISLIDRRLDTSDSEIYITFADENTHLAIKVIEGLLKRNFIVYHDNNSIQRLEQYKPYIQRLRFASNISSLKTCVVLFSRNYFQEKWNYRYHDKILDSAIDRDNPVEIYAYATYNFAGKIPASINLNLTYEITKVAPDDFQFIIDDITFKISVSSESGENPKLFKKFNHLLQKLHPNQELQLISRNDILGFEIYALEDEVFFKETSYFICFHHNAKIDPSYKEIKKSNPKVFETKRYFILIPRERKFLNSTRRMDNFKRIFLTERIRFLEDVVKKCTSDAFKFEYIPFNLTDYVIPSLMDESHTKVDFSWFTDWFNSYNKPTLVIKGLGGVGKTTLAQKLSDEFMKQKPDSMVVFIDAKDIIEELREVHDTRHILDLYAFYDAAVIKSKNRDNTLKLLDDDLFKMVLDSGNILMIIDGLDEVIANIPQFDNNAFLTSIYNYTEDLGKGKVLITCRDYFWHKSFSEDAIVEKSTTEIDFSVVLLQPFDETLAHSFFLNRHPNDTNRVKRSIALAKIFIDGGQSGNGNKFIPFVLSVIDTMIEKEKNNFSSMEIYDDTQIDFDSEYLHPNSRTDYITYHICSRETAAVMRDIDRVDAQIRFFIEIAVENLGSSNPRITIDDFELLLVGLDSFYTDKAKDGLKSHPLLQIDETDNTVSFRYDFLAEYFKTIYVTTFLLSKKNKFVFDDKLIKILCNHVKLNSGFLKEIYYRISNYSEVIEEHIFGLIKEINKYQSRDVTFEQKNKATSALLLISLLHKSKSEKLDIEANTKLVKKYFGDTNGNIVGLKIIDFVSYDTEMKVCFDFRGQKLVNCIFNNYDTFSDCKFDGNTLFQNCIFKKTNDFKIRSTNLSRLNFDNCEMDESLKVKLSGNTQSESEEYLIIRDIKAFLNLFVFGGKTNVVSAKGYLLYKYRGLTFELYDLIEKLISYNVIEYYKKKEESFDKIMITKAFENDVKDYCKQNLLSSKLSAVLKNLISSHAF